MLINQAHADKPFCNIFIYYFISYGCKCDYQALHLEEDNPFTQILIHYNKTSAVLAKRLKLAIFLMLREFPSTELGFLLAHVGMPVR